ncbi:MAG TPA: type II secretion system F family protein, partial [Burkholderiales bacterium]|nr:type II secretion system F family protein [Burkholderiales bacterium]
MPHFAYTARSAAGELLTGTLESADVSAAASHLAARGAVPVDITPTATPVTSTPDVFSGLFKPRITTVDLMMFSRQMHTLMKAGVPILRALAGLERSAANPTFAAVLSDVRVSLDEGHELAAALARHPQVFTPFYINMVR